jgi:hypothetical protein
MWITRIRLTREKELGYWEVRGYSDSADVWTHPELFKLDEEKKPLFVAGVPPDYFSETGQRWGNPIYRWGCPPGNGVPVVVGAGRP